MHWLVVLMPFYAFPIVLLLILLTRDRLQWRSELRTSPERQGRLTALSSKVAPCH